MDSKALASTPIIAFCEECGEKFNLTPTEVARSPGYIHCPNCSEVIKVAQPKKLLSELELRVEERIVRMDPVRPILTMGRKRHNDIVIRGPRISRTHATIVYLEGRYTLFDLSLNGTFIRFDSGEEVLLHKNSTGIFGSGVIGLGRNISSKPEEMILFRVTDS